MSGTKHRPAGTPQGGQFMAHGGLSGGRTAKFAGTMRTAYAQSERNAEAAGLREARRIVRTPRLMSNIPGVLITKSGAREQAEADIALVRGRRATTATAKPVAQKAVAIKNSSAYSTREFRSNVKREAFEKSAAVLPRAIPLRYAATTKPAAQKAVAIKRIDAVTGKVIKSVKVGPPKFSTPKATGRFKTSYGFAGGRSYGK